MSKKLVWPLAKMRDDGCPGVWLTWGVWNAIRGGLVNTYTNARQSHGRSEARIAANKRDRHLDVYRMDKSDWETALEIYRIGHAFNHPNNENSDLFLTPAALVELGDKLEARAFDEHLGVMREGPRAVRDKAGRIYYEEHGTFHPINGDGRTRSRWELDLVTEASGR